MVGMFSVLLASIISFCPQTSCAEPTVFQTLNTPRFTLHFESSGVHDTQHLDVDNLATESINLLNENFEELSRIFDYQPRHKVVLRFLSPDEFHKYTGSPSWTSAMFFNGEITIPIDKTQKVRLHILKRALRHEYVHAVIAEMSKNKCPAWLDEGIAQLIEGHPNSLLGPALRNWISEDSPLPLAWLDNGFTTLDDQVVPAAYAQSLFATRTLVNSHGMSSLKNYLTLLANDNDNETAFKLAFGKSIEEFEKQLGPQIRRWAASANPHP